MYEVREVLRMTVPLTCEIWSNCGQVALELHCVLPTHTQKKQSKYRETNSLEVKEGK